jgi:hypothetical protein
MVAIDDTRLEELGPDGLRHYAIERRHHHHHPHAESSPSDAVALPLDASAWFMPRSSRPSAYVVTRREGDPATQPFTRYCAYRGEIWQVDSEHRRCLPAVGYRDATRHAHLHHSLRSPTLPTLPVPPLVASTWPWSQEIALAWWPEAPGEPNGTLLVGILDQPLSTNHLFTLRVLHKRMRKAAVVDMLTQLKLRDEIGLPVTFGTLRALAVAGTAWRSPTLAALQDGRHVPAGNRPTVVPPPPPAFVLDSRGIWRIERDGTVYAVVFGENHEATGAAPLLTVACADLLDADATNACTSLRVRRCTSMRPHRRRATRDVPCSLR